jgi:hypothetical protein
MKTWLERFLLTLLAAIAGATVLTNPWQLDGFQKTTLLVAVIAISLFAARTIERGRDISAAGSIVAGKSSTASPPSPPATSSQPPQAGVPKTSSAMLSGDSSLPAHLAGGWTLHKTNDVWTIYFMVNTNEIAEFLRPEVQRGTLSIDQFGSGLSSDASRLWTEISRRVTPPEPPRTPLGPVNAELTEHINHSYAADSELQWNYEYLRQGTAIKQTQPTRLELAGFSDDVRRIVARFDRITSDAVMRSYVEAIQRLSKR